MQYTRQWQITTKSFAGPLTSSRNKNRYDEDDFLGAYLGKFTKEILNVSHEVTGPRFLLFIGQKNEKLKKNNPSSHVRKQLSVHRVNEIFECWGEMISLCA